MKMCEIKDVEAEFIKVGRDLHYKFLLSLARGADWDGVPPLPDRKIPGPPVS